MLTLLIGLLVLLLYEVKFFAGEQRFGFPLFEPASFQDDRVCFLNFLYGIGVEDGEVFPVYAHTLAVAVRNNRVLILSPAWLPAGGALVFSPEFPFVSIEFSREKVVS